MKQRTSSILKIILIIAITLAIFYVLFAKIDFLSVVDVLGGSNPRYLFIVLLLLLVIVLIGIKRWQKILEVMGYSIPYSECFAILMGALPLTSITPSKSGDVVRAYYLKDQIPISKTVGSVLSERVLDIFTLVVFSLIGMMFYGKFELVGIVFIALLAIIVMFFISHIRFNHPIMRSWNEKLQNVLLSMKTLTKDRRALLTVISYSFLIWFLAIAQTLLLFYAVGIKIPLFFTMANIPIAIFIGMMPVTLGGMGTRDAAIIFLFSEYATPSELLSVGILFSVFRYWLPSLMGIPFMRTLMR